MPEDFLVYKAKHLRKINAQRRTLSMPADRSLPILEEGGVSFSAASEAHNEPRSCYNCPLYNSGRSCQIIDRNILIRKFIDPPVETADAKRIEYWPVCSYWIYGEPNFGPERHIADIDPTSAGLGWVNAPRPGLDHSGSCCGGANGGDDCDLYITSDDDMHPDENSTGFCRVLQRDVAAMDCCSAWTDDDWVPWQTAQMHLKAPPPKAQK